MNKHELSILTNDGWIVTLLTDKELDLGDTVISSITVQPKEEYGKLLQPAASKRFYRINTTGEVEYSVEEVR